ncbi:MAG TPA: amino acid adenylation domain-containing protein, partial [Thermoanaerobaculia bacterium]|nr:amino acid adenylation domain-containing protein [Thermoanaerobaculia bacterium]
MATESTVLGFRLSPQQERLWFLQREQACTPFRAVLVVQVDGALVVEALAAALAGTVRQHEILRTAFHRQPGASTAFQVIDETAAARLLRHDLTALDTAEQERRFDGLLAECSRRSRDLGQALLPLADLVALAPERHALVLDLPALCADGNSLLQLVREIGLRYGDSLAGRERVDQPMQYADVAEWQNELVDSPGTQEGTKFWRPLAQAAAAAAELPFDPPAAAAPDFTPESVAVALPPALVQRLDEVAAGSAGDLPSLLLSCWQVLLARLAGRARLVLGVACAGRGYEDLERALGLFTRYLPLECALDEQAAFGALLGKTRAAVSELEKWQDFFDWRSLPEVDGGAGGRFLPFCFSHERLEESASHAGVSFTIDRWRVCTDRFRLKLVLLGSAAGRRAEIHYDAGSVRREDAVRLAGWLEILLRGVARAPETPIGELELLGEAERRFSLVEVNATAADLGAEVSLPELFERQVRRTPDRIALAFRDQQLSFSALARAADRLARRLRGRGVGTEVRVGFAVDRSLDMIVGLLGILKAGGAYVPLDPGYPQDRLALMLADARVRVLLTDRARVAALPALDGVDVVCLERGAVAPPGPGDRAAAGDRLPPALPAALAYVIYTSGSTGRPKGVMVSHRAIANRLLWMQRELPLGEDDSVLQKTPYSFDASIWEIFVPLIAGARVLMAEPDGHRDNVYLLEVIRDRELTTLQLVPSLLALLVQEAGFKESCRTLRRLFCGGEALSDGLRQSCLDSLAVELVNLYGPTEGAIDATFHRCSRERLGAMVPIGRPLDNVQVYALDHGGRPAPPGLVGELHLGGAGLARGYLGRPDATAERFVPNPFAGSGERLYRTGDLARLRPDGAFEFVGRADHQIKLRGFRIELGEIEAALGAHPWIKEAVAVVRPSPRGAPAGQRLVAYAALREDAADSEAGGALKKFLADRLPEPMVPSVIVLLAALPRLPNGKLDRGALPEPEAASGLERRRLTAARNPLEKTLADLWMELLGLQQVGVEENFFEAGGHSLLATQVVSRIRHRFGVDFKVRHLFEAPTIEGLAAKLDLLLGDGARDLEPAITHVPRRGEQPLSFGQQRLWFLQQLDPGSSAYHLPCAVRLEGELEVRALEDSLRETVRRHEILRTRFPMIEGRPVQEIEPLVGLRILALDLSGLSPRRSEAAALAAATRAAWRPFDLAAAPALRCVLVRLSPQSHLAVLVLHHIAGDGWSTWILVREMMALFAAFAAGQASPLAEPALQYADYAVWQRGWLAGEVLAAQLDYWKRQLAGDLPALRLPIDRPRSAVRSSAAGNRSQVVPRPLVEAAHGLGLREGCSLFMTLLAAFDVLLYRYGGQRDLLVGSPVANRPRVELEGLLGMFVNSLVLRTRWSGEPTVREFLQLVRETALEAFAHEAVPLERLVDELQPERSAQGQPLFQVMFMLQNFPHEQVFELPGLHAAATALATETAKFDLLAELREIGAGLFCGVEYKAEMFDAATIERLFTHLRSLLQGMVSNPEQRISELAMLTAGERHQAVAEWNDTESPYPAALSIHALIEARVRLSPRAAAVFFAGEERTYTEVNRQANRLAHHLRELGARPGKLVGVYLERCAEMVPALLGV